MLGPIATARDTRGVSVRVVPFAELPHEVRSETRLVVTSHVSWATGREIFTDPIAASHASSCSTVRRASARSRPT